MGIGRSVARQALPCRCAKLRRTFFAVLLLTAPAGAQATEPRNILVLQSYHYGNAWTQTVMAGIAEVLGGRDDIALDVEYMDTKRRADEPYLRRLRHAYEEKYRDRAPNVVLACDDNALRFLLVYRDVLFPGAPIVFCGVNHFREEMMAGHENVTGVVEAADLEHTLDLALRLHPDTKRVVVVHDETATGRAIRARLQPLLPTYRKQVGIEFLSDLTAKELTQELGGLSSGDLVFFLCFFRDKVGRVLSARESAQLVAQNTPVPVYTCWELHVGNGPVGGRVVSGHHQGRAAAELAERILKGQSAGAIPVVQKSPNRYVFDDQQMRRFGIRRSDLPEDAHVVNRPAGLTPRQWWLIWGTIVFLAAETLLVALLLINRQRRRRVQAELRRNQERLRAVLEGIDDALFVHDSDGRILYCNQAACRRLGYSRDELLGMTTREIDAPEFAGDFAQRLARQMAEGRFACDGVHVTKDGRRIPVDINTSVIDYEGQKAILAVMRDISRRKEAEEALRESERRFRQLAEAIDQVFWFTALHPERVLYVSPAFESIWDRSTEELYADPRTWVEAIHPQDRPAVEEAFQAFITGQAESYNVEYRIVRPDESVRWILDHGAPIRNERGEIYRVSGIAKDITARKVAERSLRGALDRLQEFEAIVSRSPAVVFRWRVDDAWSVDFVTNNVQQFGYAADDFLEGRVSWPSITHPDDVERLDREVRAYLASGARFFSQEYRLVTRAGETRWVTDRNLVIYDAEDRPLYIEGIVLDVTDRRRAEEALRDSEERLALALEGADLGMWDRNVRTGEAVYNEQWAAMLGYSLDEIEPHTRGWRELVHPDDFPHVRAALDAHLNGEMPNYEAEYRMRAKNGAWRWILARGRVVERDEEGQPLRITGTHLDITARKEAEEERRRLQEQIQHAQKLESLGVLAGGIAHDFNNLLVAILGNADLALAELSPVSPARRSITEIETAAQRAAELCRQMLAYSGKGRFVIQSLDLNQVVSEMTHLLEVSISKKVVLKYHLADNLPAIEADATQMRQVIMNLITNASEAIGDHSGVIAINTGAIQCDRDYLRTAFLDEGLDEGYYVSLEVSDTGCGMDRQTRESIFDPFFTTKFTGRGLGLAAVLGIVRGHGGAIKVYSEQGKGSTFKVLFPASDTTPQPVAAEEENASAWEGDGTVLLVDDEETIRAVGQRMLEHLGFRVLTATNGQEALDIFRNRADEIACILLDLTMPSMDGEECFRELRRICPDVCVILSSGYNEQEVVNRFAGKGLAGFVQKPYRAATLAAKIREAMGRDADES
jgi:PAS domain S-box-containing protein